MRRLRFHLAISPAQLLSYYQGRHAALSVHTEQGVRLQIGLHHFRPFVSHQGLQGYFEITLDNDNAFQQLLRLTH
ncbi:DUF2835 family protein [Oceanisphaera avium]|uniref:DUF2835 domain-containing protein n=1 Tax=Oceanisphaera avium TaxID=1903694 RepID=A0A1Y0CVR3_9GAMM|nr:DUF2835 family protein [Oceanisphaera avium]ART79339.1 hypothetical protein CBP12_03580 [Oceanisphaera avium]